MEDQFQRSPASQPDRVYKCGGTRACGSVSSVEMDGGGGGQCYIWGGSRACGRVSCVGMACYSWRLANMGK